VGRRSSLLAKNCHDTQPVWTWIAAVIVVCAALLAVFGLPPVSLHGPLHYLGVMDPLCGSTRSVYLTLHGNVHEAMRFNPAGPVVLVGAVIMVIRAVVGRLLGRWLSIRIPARILWPVAVIAIVALEVNQQMHASLLTQPWNGM
jgi:hypothetical protein